MLLVHNFHTTIKTMQLLSSVQCGCLTFDLPMSVQCRPLVCTDVDRNCAECGQGAMCITCAPGFVRGYHSGDTLCRRPVKGCVDAPINYCGCREATLCLQRCPRLIICT